MLESISISSLLAQAGQAAQDAAELQFYEKGWFVFLLLIAAVALGWYNWRLYGGVSATGYGDMSHNFAVANILSVASLAIFNFMFCDRLVFRLARVPAAGPSLVAEIE